MIPPFTRSWIEPFALSTASVPSPGPARSAPATPGSVSATTPMTSASRRIAVLQYRPPCCEGSNRDVRRVLEPGESASTLCNDPSGRRSRGNAEPPGESGEAPPVDAHVGRRPVAVRLAPPGRDALPVERARQALGVADHVA